MIVLRLIFCFYLVFNKCLGESIRSQKCRLYTQKFNILTSKNGVGNGTLDLAKESPHIVDIGYKLDHQPLKWLCQGTMISPVYILTVAHCITSTSYRSRIPVKIRLGVLARGGLGSVLRDIEKVVRYPDYIPISNYYDIGLVKMSSKVALTEYIRPICLPDTDVKSNFNYLINYNYKHGTLNSLPSLNKYPIYLISTDKCNLFYRNTKHTNLRDAIIDSQLCGKEQLSSNATCISVYPGASLQIDHPTIKGGFIQVGLQSFGFNCSLNTPKVFTKVYSYVNWIESIVWATEEK